MPAARAYILLHSVYGPARARPLGFRVLDLWPGGATRYLSELNSSRRADKRHGSGRRGIKMCISLFPVTPATRRTAATVDRNLRRR